MSQSSESLVPDLTDPEVYEAAVRELVASTAPGLFAVVQEREESPDAYVAAWGVEFADRRVAAFTAGLGGWLSLADTDRLLSALDVPGVRTRIVPVA
ncbi:hypothetical protein [Actinosynnema sp. NPDC020468]|uniref:hypothetical protein n=1 Tax=Actinosynnema sp. NPDC020468 TaxID=3154488 RepID=UPI0033F07725